MVPERLSFSIPLMLLCLSRPGANVPLLLIQAVLPPKSLIGSGSPNMDPQLAFEIRKKQFKSILGRNPSFSSLEFISSLALNV